MEALTPQEIAICQTTGEVWNAFLKLDRMHPSEVDEFRIHIHALQNIIMARAAQRLLPDIFPTYIRLD